MRWIMHAIRGFRPEKPKPKFYALPYVGFWQTLCMNEMKPFFTISFFIFYRLRKEVQIQGLSQMLSASLTEEFCL
jgi:hypothetical protein